MPETSAFLAGLSNDQRRALENRLLQRQAGKCFICDKPIDVVLHAGQLDIDHIDPLANQGLDEENNFALTHSSCNRSKGSSDLRVARRMAEFEELQQTAREAGARGANLGHVLRRYGGAKSDLRLKRTGDSVEFVLLDETIHRVPIYKDRLSGMEYFFSQMPIEFLHHDDRINPRGIGANIRGLIEEFMKKRPQLHVSLGWWAPEDGDDSGPVKVFDGQHKAAAQILLGVNKLPIRVFVNPDKNVLLTANTNAGDKLRQVAFDAAVMRHLGSTLYAERVRQYQELKGLEKDDYKFSERDLVTFFRGEHREMLRYIIDAVRDSITYNKENKLMEFVEWAGKGADRPLAYASIERTFFSEFLYQKALENGISEGMDTGENLRLLEQSQIVRLMSLFASVFFVGSWDPEIGGRRVETRLQKGEPIPETHLRAWRVAREEVLAMILKYVRLVIEHYYAYAGQAIRKNGLMQQNFPPALWERLELFLKNMAALPCWIDKNLSITVFGAKRNRDYWDRVFQTGRTPDGVQVLAQPIEITKMIQ